MRSITKSGLTYCKSKKVFGILSLAAISSDSVCDMNHNSTEIFQGTGKKIKIISKVIKRYQETKKTYLQKYQGQSNYCSRCSNINIYLCSIHHLYKKKDGNTHKKCTAIYGTLKSLCKEKNDLPGVATLIIGSCCIQVLFLRTLSTCKIEIQYRIINKLK